MKLTIIILICLIITTCLYAEIPEQMNYQGKITDTLGVARNGYHALAFNIYDEPVGGVSLWTEVHDSVMVYKGLFDVVLGSTNPIDVPFDTTYWLEIELEGEILVPRVLLTTVPYAFRARSTDFADSAGKVSWGNIAAMPAGFEDNIDDTGHFAPTETDTFIAFWDSIRNMPPGFEDNIDDTGHFAPTETDTFIADWDSIRNMPPGFADGVDNTGADDAITISLNAADTISIGNAVFWGDNNSMQG